MRQQFQIYGELHSAKAKALTVKLKAGAKMIKGEAIVDKRTGVRMISKLISELAAKPLLVVKRGRDIE